MRNPPEPLSEIDVLFQIGHLLELEKKYGESIEVYMKCIKSNPTHTKSLQQLGWLHLLPTSPFHNQQLAIQYLSKAIEAGSIFLPRSERQSKLVLAWQMLHAGTEIQ